jgi:hypothetical protein
LSRRDFEVFRFGTAIAAAQFTSVIAARPKAFGAARTIEL